MKQQTPQLKRSIAHNFDEKESCFPHLYMEGFGLICTAHVFDDLGLVYNMPEKFENGFFTLKKHCMFSVHITPQEFENVPSLIPTVRTSVHNNTSRKGNFSKTLLKPEEFQNASFAC